MSLLMLLLTITGLSVVGYRVLRPSPKRQLFREAVLDYESQLFYRAEEVSQQLQELAPDDPAVAILRGRILARLNRDDEAIKQFRRAMAAVEPYSTYAALGLADQFYHHGNYPTAEKYFRQYLEKCPDDLKANSQFANLLQAQARTWESIPYAVRRIALGQFNAEELMMVGLAQTHWAIDKDVLYLCKLRFPQHSINRLGEVKLAYAQNGLERELDLLRTIADENPEQIEPQVLLGKYYRETGDVKHFLEWHAQLGERADGNPEIWYLRGMWEKDQERWEPAASCFLRALQCSVSHTKSIFQLSQTAARFNENSVDAEFSQQVKAASDIDYLLTGLMGQIDPERTRKLVGHLGTLHRYWEAAAWCNMICRFVPQTPDWARQDLLRYRRLALSQAPDPSQKFAASLSLKLGIEPAASPYHLLPEDKPASTLQPPTLNPSTIRFEETASEAGVRFQYHNGTTAESGLEHILQATGGAVIVLDYDGDGWPDLYFVQSGEWPVQETENPYRDKLFRNLGNGHFQDVSEQAGLGDGLYSQGATAGDLDNDGDPDLIVTNAGANRVYRNNGDGTFTDLSAQMPGSFLRDEWSMSAACTDLDGDGNLDLYIVNYVLLHQALEQLCKINGRPRGCNPTMFDAQQDRVFLNQGQGDWTDVTEPCGFVAEDGKGLGIIAADFDRDGQPEIFVGNDTVANFYFRQTGVTSDGLPRFENVAVLSGTALNEEGRAQASMGIARGDVDSDGLLDLFITNFYADSNTLYRQQAPSSFREITRTMNLRNCSYYQLGFGTQFLDADLDGDLDLLISNGHIDHTFATGEPDLMPPQFLEGFGDWFEERPAEQCGPYFAGKYLGRSLSLLDWNRDGLLDAVITHLDAPAALLTNRSERRGKFLTLKLVGTESSRDAIGARVRIEQGHRVQYGFVTGGDGYLSRNEACLHFGLSNSEAPVQITVDWPSGRTTSLLYPHSDRPLVVVEGIAQIWPLY